MWLFVFFICISVNTNFTSGYTRMKEITVFIDRNQESNLICYGKVVPELAVNEVFRIYLSSKYDLTRKRCFMYNTTYKNLIDTFWSVTTKNQHGYQSSNSSIARPGEMHIRCEFYTKDCSLTNMRECEYSDSKRKIDNGITCNIPVKVINRHVSSNDPTVSLTANGVEIKMEPSNYGSYSYDFYDGQPTLFNCSKINGDSVMLTYSGKDGTRISTGFQAADSVELYMKLTEVHQGTVLSCDFIDRSMKKNSIKVFLNWKAKYPNEMLDFEVNGLVLSRTKKSQDQTFYYQYDYYNNEALTIRVVKNDDVFGNMNCDSSIKDADTSKSEIDENINETAFPLNIILSNEQKGTLTCTVVDTVRNVVNHMQITLLHYIPKYSPFIDGLSMANILVQYTNTKSETVIQYDCTKIEKLVLICSYYGTSDLGTWSYSKDDIISTSSNDSRLHLGPLQKNAIIQCKGNSIHNQNTITSLELLRHRGMETVTEEKKEMSQPPDEETESKIIIYAVCATVLVIIIVATLIAVVYRKLKHAAQYQDPNNINYETLPRHHEGPMPLPRQWSRSNEYVVSPSIDSNIYSTPYSNADEMYSRPLPRHLRQSAEANQLDLPEEPAYATVSVENDQIIQANERPDPQSQGQSNTDERNLGDRSGSPAQYANLFKSYVNADGVEPAYCVPNVTK